MTKQITDTIIIKGIRYHLYNTPLDSYWTKKNLKPVIRMTKTSCWRGYLATWEIIDKSLYLIDIIFYAQDGDHGIDFIFPESKGKVRADWFTGELKVPVGDILHSELMDDDIHDTDWRLKIVKGNLTGHRYQANY